MQKIQFIVINLLLLFVLCACSNSSEDNQNIEAKLTGIAAQYIEAEYAGNKDVLLNITTGDAKKAVEEGQLDIFNNQHLDKIVDTKVNKISDEEYHLVITVSSSPSVQEQATNYFENVTLTKTNNTWLISKVDRDQ
ncbi:hypothetical protein AV540_25410 [Brevibacillus parabrevis]|uniref:hypothetical protein n=1 Tax=Brevibacillus parabrevis TaxID=54914 RepID=UPI0007AC25F5|nr:hypothetical protein [Brevibacillus parabrevis]KZE42851.1 hypothetical protein AV540_25410 [Brevibacillus parabrevis]